MTVTDGLDREDVTGQLTVSLQHGNTPVSSGITSEIPGLLLLGATPGGRPVSELVDPRHLDEYTVVVAHGCGPTLAVARLAVRDLLVIAPAGASPIVAVEVSLDEFGIDVIRDDCALSFDLPGAERVAWEHLVRHLSRLPQIDQRWLTATTEVLSSDGYSLPAAESILPREWVWDADDTTEVGGSALSEECALAERDRDGRAGKWNPMLAATDLLRRKLGCRRRKSRKP